MQETDLMREWCEFNSSVRRKYLAAFRALPGDTTEKDTGASYPSLMRICCHVLDAYNWRFISVIEKGDGDYNPEIWHSGITPDEADLETGKTDSSVSAKLQGTTGSELQNTVTWVRNNMGRRQTHRLKLRDIIWHMAEEELKHRDEMNAILWQMDSDPPQTGWDRR